MTKEDYMKLSKERLAEILSQKDLEDEYARGIYRDWALVVPTLVNPQPPCYAPDGICTNPFHDCINCPRIGITGGFTTTCDTDLKK
jgi:hypothetical protein